MLHAVGSSLARWPISGTSGLFYPDTYDLLGGGILDKWSDFSDPRWPLWDAMIQEHGEPKAVWWMITFHSKGGTIPTSMERKQAVRVYERMRESLGPAVDIYVSGQPKHTPEGLCPVTNQNAARMSWALAGQLVNHPKTQVIIGPAFNDITTANNNGSGDPCHQGPVGIIEHALILESAFRGLVSVGCQ